MSPVAAAKPACSASPLPRPGWVITLALGHSARVTATVSSTECPSTRTISSIQGGRVPKTCGRLAASFRAGMMTLTAGAIASAGETARYDGDPRARADTSLRVSAGT